MPSAVEKLKQEFATHVAESSDVKFEPPADLRGELSRINHDLGIKKQLGSITPQENQLLRDLDTTNRNIAYFNYKVSAPPEHSPAAGGSEQAYDLGMSRIVPEEETSQPFAAPKITDDVADQIISGINKQFEEKVMQAKQAKTGGEKSRVPASSNIPPSSVSLGQGGSGANLHDFLSAVRQERPDVPFKDEDSQFDLSKLARGE